MRKLLILSAFSVFMFGAISVQPSLLSPVDNALAMKLAMPQNRNNEPPKFRIELTSRAFTPPSKLELDAIKKQHAGQPDDRVHFLLQFESVPDEESKKKLEGSGLSVLSYVSGNAYVVSMLVTDLEDLVELPRIRWAGPLRPNDKVDPALWKGEGPEWAETDQGQIVLTLLFHPDVSEEKATALLESLGGEVFNTISDPLLANAAFEPGSVAAIAKQDAIQYVDYVDPPLEELNDQARGTARVAPLSSTPYNLTGSGVTALVYDVGIVDTAHPDFGTRVIQVDGDVTETTVDHSTHVAGTLGGSGANSNGLDSAGIANGGTPNQWAGMAPLVNIRSFGSVGGRAAQYNGSADLNADFTTAITAGIDLATMSLGNNAYKYNPPRCGQLGDYSSTAVLVDNIVTGSISDQDLIFLEAAGNERADPDGTGPLTPLQCGGFGTISSPATAKNTIAVGAIDSNPFNLSPITNFSSFGPTDDGRLKPDIVAPGRRIKSPSFVDLDPDGPGPQRRNGSLDPGEVQNAYVVKSGTSMATPVAAGASALLIEQWRSTRGATSRPAPHTVKAILVHTATDFGRPGPDYSYGWGALDAKDAVDLVIADDTEDVINTDRLGAHDSARYSFESDGSQDVRVTLAWDDPPATRLSARTLINDIDLTLRDPDGVVYRPFLLDPANPNNSATRGRDSRNNVEMVIGSRKAGTWTALVSGARVRQDRQPYTLITPEHVSFKMILNVGRLLGLIDWLPPEVFPRPSAKQGLQESMNRALRRAGFERSNFNQATKELKSLRRHLDGCEETLINADKNDWVVNCSAQNEIREVIDSLIADLEGPSLPDLILEDIVAPSSVPAGTDLADLLIVKVGNLGGALAPGTIDEFGIPKEGYMVDLVLSEDLVVPPGFATVPQPAGIAYAEDGLLQQGRISRSPDVPAGSTIELSNDPPVTSDIGGVVPFQALGELFLCGRIDPGDVVTESNEDNNVFCTPIEVVQPLPE